MFSSYNLSAAFDASDVVCETPALASSLADPLFESIVSETLLVTDSVSIEVSLLEGLSLVREGREDMVQVDGCSSVKRDLTYDLPAVRFRCVQCTFS